MFKALLKKQLIELCMSYSGGTNKKKNKKSNVGKGGIAVSIIIMLLLGLSVAAMMMGVSFSLKDVLLPQNFAWIYFAIVGVLGVIIATIISMFNANTSFFKAKDNELLLSMPIPPGYILLVRMISVWFFALLFVESSTIPAMIVLKLDDEFAGMMNIPMAAIMGLILSFFVVGLSCLFGWIIAEINSHLKNRAIISTILILVLLAGYYFIYFRLQTYLAILAENSVQVGLGLKKWANPFYRYGLACTGNWTAFLIAAICFIGFFAIVYVVMSKRFISITTKSQNNAAGKTFSGSMVKSTEIKKTLIKREFKHFTSSSAYMVNCALGTVIMVILAIVVVVKADVIRGFVDTMYQEVPIFEGLILPLAAASVCLMSSMNFLTAPSISLEGKSIWILQTLPIDIREIFRAKQKLHLILTLIPSLILTAALIYVIKGSFISGLCCAACVAAFVAMDSAAALALGIKRPNLEWMNETQAVKQSVNELFLLLGGWILSVAIAGLCIAVRNYIGMELFLLIVTAILTVFTVIFDRWIARKGQKLFVTLS